MKASKSAIELKKLIVKAIDDQVLTQEEHDQIVHLAMEDWHIDSQEKALLNQLLDMIENKMVKIKRK
jgi:hypothetical protein